MLDLLEDIAANEPKHSEDTGSREAPWWTLRFAWSTILGLGASQVALGHLSSITEAEWSCCLLLYQDSPPRVAAPAVPSAVGAGVRWQLSPWRS